MMIDKDSLKPENVTQLLADEIKKFDTSFEFSSDQSVWRRGTLQLEKIRTIAKMVDKNFGAGTSKEIWKKLKTDFCKI